MTNSADWPRWYADCRAQAVAVRPFETSGRLTRAAGLVLEAVGLKLPLGAGCLVEPPEGAPIEAEVVGFAAERLFLMPTGDVHGLMPGAIVRPLEALPPFPSPRAAPPRAGEGERGKRLPAVVAPMPFHPTNYKR